MNWTNIFHWCLCIKVCLYSSLSHTHSWPAVFTHGPNQTLHWRCTRSVWWGPFNGRSDWCGHFRPYIQLQAHLEKLKVACVKGLRFINPGWWPCKLAGRISIKQIRNQSQDRGHWPSAEGWDTITETLPKKEKKPTNTTTHQTNRNRTSAFSPYGSRLT